jgi:hypothetical protein
LYLPAVIRRLQQLLLEVRWMRIEEREMGFGPVKLLMQRPQDLILFES